MARKLTKALATQIAKTVRNGSATSWVVMRDIADTATAGELDPWQLDMLTDWIKAACLTLEDACPNP